MLNPTDYTKIAIALFKESNPWERWENATEAVKLVHLESAEHVINMLVGLGFSVVSGGQHDSDGKADGGKPSSV